MPEPYRRRRRRRRAAPGPAVPLLLGAVLLCLTAAVAWVLLSRGLPAEDIEVPGYVERDYLPVNPYSRPGDPLEKINGVVIHYVGNPGTYGRCVELTAWLCREFRLNPETDVIRHYAVTGKECPRYYVEHPEAWDTFRADVAAEMERQKEAEKNS